MGEGTNCSQCGCCKGKKWCGIVVLVLLILNTIFIGGIWRASGGVCLFTGQHKFSGDKFCPMMGNMNKANMPNGNMMMQPPQQQ